MAGLAGILGNPVLEQILIYGVVQQLIGAALTPFTTAVINAVNAADPQAALSPADMADAVIRGIASEEDAAAEAKFSGVSPERFHTLALLAGNAPDPTSLAVGLRRKLISAADYDRGIRQGRLRDEWAGLVQELAVIQPSPEAMLAAYLEGQVDEATARDKYQQLGGDPAYFDILFNTEGQAPSPVEALALANRGIIPWGGSGPAVVSYEQAFLEGPWRNKWLEPFRALGAYLPPPRTVTAMHREGSLSDAQASKLLEQHGLTPELAAAYLSSSTSQKLAKTKNLAEGTVLDLYRDRIIPRAEAAALIVKLGYDAAEAEFILEVEDLRVEARAITAAVTRIGSLFTGHKIDQSTAAGALTALGVDPKGAGELIGVWDLERAANVKLPTPAQIEAAFGIGILSQDEAIAELGVMGYSPHDAWLVLSVHNKAALPNEPGASALPPPAGP